MRHEAFRIGLIVNPMAGRGGPLALHGSDDMPWDESAAHAVARAGQAIRHLVRSKVPLVFLTAAGTMGQEILQKAGLIASHVIEVPVPCSATESKNVARLLVLRGIDLLLFAGGDGTARDIFDAIGEQVPMIGIPAGVKMHSAVFALSPDAAGRLALAVAERPSPTRLVEVMDADEAEFRQGRPSARLYGLARVPDVPVALQVAKGMRGGGGVAAMNALGVAIARHAAPDHLHILGPGMTLAPLKDAFGIAGSRIGVDVVRNGRMLARDADRNTLWQMLATYPEATLYAGLIGAQGFLFGRGNQQLGPEILRQLGRRRMRVIATQEKLAALPRAMLFVDTGDCVVDHSLAGYLRVETGPGDTVMMACRAASQVLPSIP